MRNWIQHSQESCHSRPTAVLHILLCHSRLSAVQVRLRACEYLPSWSSKWNGVRSCTTVPLVQKPQLFALQSGTVPRLSRGVLFGEWCVRAVRHTTLCVLCEGRHLSCLRATFHSESFRQQRQQFLCAVLVHGTRHCL